MIGVGEFARASDGVVFIYGHDEERYHTVRVDRDEECTHLECDLTPWTPTPGERIAEANNEDCIGGTVIETGDCSALVKWTGFIEPQMWRNNKLEPYCS
jgi:hypothetical protein